MLRAQEAALAAVLALGVATCVATVPSRAAAHDAGFSRAEYVLDGDTLAVELLGHATEFGVSFDDGRGATAEALLARITVSQHGTPCRLAPGPLAPEPREGFSARGAWTCGTTITSAEVQVGLLADLPPSHTHLAHVRDRRSPTAAARHVVRRSAPVFTAAVAGASASAAAPAGSPWRRAASFAALGVEHILLGFDHLAFLVAVLLAASTLRRGVQLVTSFTLAHSLTLALAATGTFTLAPRVVEPLIAASIVAVALENLWLLRRGPSGRVHDAARGSVHDAARGRVHDAARDHARDRALRRRWLVTFVFGLVHGLGFAGALGDVRLTGGAFALALASFNLGVELGQLAVAAALVPLLLAARRSARLAPQVARGGSLAVGLAGLVWLADRVAFTG